ncbi:unnamed protein product [Vitrella brassicaformis CCMP3155]|uniref:Uncharacterized protein n=1 Tax=Vitrella brassicaformis (strain CCMP3155) TaxID=1169540 RepID=A0A0G4E8G6_VITBC|nr:unnamed protein product [Vitrella brassicaformis CCMP3155]|eukprot:CEL92044.1 unnamed protein product [Vitrella brassicaformis CCMP3155]
MREALDNIAADQVLLPGTSIYQQAIDEDEVEVEAATKNKRMRAKASGDGDEEWVPEEDDEFSRKATSKRRSSKRRR